MRISSITLALLLVVNSVVLAETTTQFTVDGNQSDIVTLYLEKDVVNDDTIIEFPNAEVLSASYKVSGGADDEGNYPEDVSITISGNTWKYSGEGYGALGYQNTFSNGTSFSAAIFEDESGGETTVEMYIPVNATITDAEVTLEGMTKGTGDLGDYKLVSENTNEGSHSLSPSVLKDGNDRYVVWADNGDLEDKDAYYSIIFNSGGSNSWNSDPVRLTPQDSLYTYDDALIVGDSDFLLVGWLYSGTLQSTYSTDGGNSWSAIEDFDYDYYFSLTVTDGSGDTSTDTVTVTVLSDNIPAADAGPNFTACDLMASGDDYRVYLNGSNSFDSEDGTDIDFLWTVIDTGITISAGQSTKSNPYFNHPVDLSDDTDFRIELMVTDGSGFCSGYDTVRVTCLANMCPLANAGNDFELSSGCNTSFVLDGSSSLDPNGESLTYNWISLDGYISNIENGTSDSATFNIPDFTVDKDLRFELTVSDGTNEDKDTLEVEFKFDEAPVADAGEDISTNLISVILDGSGSTDDNLWYLGYEWTSLDDDGPSISSSNQPVATVNFNDSHTGGAYRFELEVDDGYCFDKDTVTITVLDNMNPIAEAGDNFALSGGCQTIFYLDGTDSDDPEGTSLTYLWSVTNELSTYLSNTNSADSAMFTINDMVIGEKVTFYLTVTDVAGLSDMDSVAITILDDIPPVADAAVDFESCEYVKSGSNYRVYLNGSGSSDIDGTIKFKWVQLEGIDVNLSSSQSRKETPYFKYPSSVTENSEVIFQLRVYDSEEYCEDFDIPPITSGNLFSQGANIL